MASGRSGTWSPMRPMMTPVAMFILRFAPPPVRWLRSMRYCFRPSRTGCSATMLPRFEDTDQLGKLLDLNDPAGAVRHAVIVAADRDEAIVADAPFQLEHGIEAMFGQCLQFGQLGRESLGDDPLGGAVDADVGDRIEPVDELSVEVLEVAEATAEKEVLADIAERPLDLPLRLGPIGSAGARLEAIMLRQREQRTVVGDVALVVLAGHRGLHAVVEDLDRHAADRLEGLDMTAQQRLQVLVEDVARE